MFRTCVLIGALLLGALSIKLASGWMSPHEKAAAIDTRILGSGDSLADAISGTYERPHEVRVKSEKPVKAVAAKPAQPKRPPQSFADGYRTLCVRLCDGFYFPISSSTQPDKFARDEAACQDRCSSPAKLFVYKNSTGSTETMVDLEGKPYSELISAFKHRVSYDASCACKPQPWTEEASNLHRVYALEEKAAAGNTAADVELRILKSVVTEQIRQARLKSGARPLATAAIQRRFHSASDAPPSRPQVVRAAVATRTVVVRSVSRSVRAEQRAVLAPSGRTGSAIYQPKLRLTKARQRAAEMVQRPLRAQPAPVRIRVSDYRVAMRPSRGLFAP